MLPLTGLLPRWLAPAAAGPRVHGPPCAAGCPPPSTAVPAAARCLLTSLSLCFCLSLFLCVP